MPTTRVKSYRRRDGTVVKASNRQTKKNKKPKKHLLDDPKILDRYIYQSKATGIPVTKKNAKEVFNAQKKTSRRVGLGIALGTGALSLYLGKRQLNKNPAQDIRKTIDVVVERKNKQDLAKLASKFEAKVMSAEAQMTPNYDLPALPPAPGSKMGKVPNLQKQLAREAFKTKLQGRLAIIKNKALGGGLKTFAELSRGSEQLPGTPFVRNLTATAITSTAGIYAANKAARKSKSTSTSKKRTSKYNTKSNKSKK